MQYPIKAERQGIGGKVIVQYMIDTFGNTTVIKILQGVRNDLNSEAIRLIKLLKGWPPASLHNEKFNAYKRQTFIFIPAKRKRKL